MSYKLYHEKSPTEENIIDAKILNKPEVQKYKEGQVVQLDNGQLMFYFDCQEEKIKEKIKSTL